MLALRNEFFSTDCFSLEQNLGIIAASLPTLRVFFNDIGQSLRNSAGSIFSGWTRRSKTTIDEETGDKESQTELNTGPVWSDTRSGISGKSIKVAEHPLEQEMDLKYLRGDHPLETFSRDVR